MNKLTENEALGNCTLLTAYLRWLLGEEAGKYVQCA